MGRRIGWSLGLLLLAVPARANPSSVGVIGIAAVAALPLMMLAAVWLSGGSRVMAALGLKRRGIGERIGWILAAVLLSAMSAELGILVILLGGLGVFARAVRLIYWGVGSLKAPENRPPHLAGARAGKLIGFGLALAAGTAVVGNLGLADSFMKSGTILLMRKSNEGDTKGHLTTIRSALSIYYADMKGAAPARLEALTAGGKYLGALPGAQTPDYHPVSSSVRTYSPEEHAALRLSDEGGWGYVAASTNSAVFVNCTHTDSRGTVWARY